MEMAFHATTNVLLVGCCVNCLPHTYSHMFKYQI